MVTDMKKRTHKKAPTDRGKNVDKIQEQVDKANQIRHQMDADALQIVLRDYGLGEGKVADLCMKWHELSEEICELAGIKAERDYFIYKLDRALQQRMPEHFVPFEERYCGLLKPPMPIGGK